MTSHAKEILNEAVHRQESLRVSGGFEPPHLTLPLSGRLVRDFDSVVLVLFGAVYNRRHDRAVGNRVAAQLVGDQTPRHTALPFQQAAEEAPSCTPIAPGLDENVDDVPVLIDRPPEILLSSLGASSAKRLRFVIDRTSQRAGRNTVPPACRPHPAASTIWRVTLSQVAQR